RSSQAPTPCPGHSAPEAPQLGHAMEVAAAIVALAALVRFVSDHALLAKATIASTNGATTMIPAQIVWANSSEPPTTATRMVRIVKSKNPPMKYVITDEVLRARGSANRSHAAPRRCSARVAAPWAP